MASASRLNQRNVICATCHTGFPVHVYSIGYSDLIEWRCTRCPIVLGQGWFDAAPQHCQCGGQFSRDAKHRCPHCNAELEMADLAAQLGWTPEKDQGRGLIITEMVSATHQVPPTKTP